MNDSEQKFKDFFNAEKVIVSAMDDSQLAEHILKLEAICFEARARLTAADDEGRTRKSRKKTIEPAINSDSITSNAINQIDARNKKLSKEEKLIASLVALGMSEEDARQSLNKGKTLNKLRALGDNRPANEIEIKPEVPIENKPFINPFAKREE